MQQRIPVAVIISVSVILGLVIGPSPSMAGPGSKLCEFTDFSIAKCVGKRLISAKLGEMPSQLRVLNLDKNQIRALEDEVFWRTPRLVDISIAENHLDTISINAFQGLNELKRLNLSHNRLETFNEFLLDKLYVEVLDLSGNNFVYADGRLSIQSPTVRDLYLKSCKLVVVDGLLKNMPSLERVDLSNNYLTSLELPSFLPLVELSFVDLQKNSLRCNKDTQVLFDWFRKHSIVYEGPFCAIQRKDMFQRMEMSLDKLNSSDIDENERLKNSSLAKINATAVENEFVMSLFDKTYFRRCLLMDHESVCHLLENYKNTLNCDRYVEEQQRHTKLNFYFIVVIFIIGMFIGSVLALCCCQAAIYCRTDKQRRSRRTYNRTTRMCDADQVYNNTVQMRPLNHQDNIDLNSRAPSYGQSPDARLGRDSEARQDAGVLVEANGFHDFVNELFSRRRSHRRVIAAGTNLVRQLSRSSMNLLRRQQSRTANANARAAGPTRQNSGPTPTTPEYEPVDFYQDPSQAQRRRPSFTYSSEMINSNNDSLFEDIRRQERRSESPPPTYDLCVRIPKSGYVSD